MQWLFDIVREQVSQDVGFVDRGDGSSYDFTIVDFTIDGSTHTLDLSAIVPEHAKLVLLTVVLQAPPIPDKSIRLFPITATSSFPGEHISTRFPTRVEWNQAEVQLDSTRLIKYNIDNTTWTLINIWVRGWWLHRTEF